MRAISLFSGAGGFELGFERAGIDTVLQAEQDAWCLGVLARHWPETERLTDVRQVDARTFSGRSGHVARAGHSADPQRLGSGGGRVAGDGVDLVYGGFPCQDLSVAGHRAGLGGARSGLWSEFRRVLSELRPTWFCLENVPGLLSSARGRDFGRLLSEVEKLRYGVAWAVLDARYFGVPQRRRRVFVVGCLGNPHAAAAVLAVCEGSLGHPAPSSEPGQDVAPCLEGGARGTSRKLSLVAGGLDLVVGNDDGQTYRALLSRASGYRGDLETENFVVLADPIAASEGRTYTHEGTRNFRLHNVVDGVRRLTPRECERLMGWPDDHTRYTADGRELADSHRYRLCGNGVVATVAEWIGHRLVAVDRQLPA